jgi:hypothetical protein
MLACGLCGGSDAKPHNAIERRDGFHGEVAPALPQLLTAMDAGDVAAPIAAVIRKHGFTSHTLEMFVRKREHWDTQHQVCGVVPRAPPRAVHHALLVVVCAALSQRAAVRSQLAAGAWRRAVLLQILNGCDFCCRCVALCCFARPSSCMCIARVDCSRDLRPPPRPRRLRRLPVMAPSPAAVAVPHQRRHRRRYSATTRRRS